MQAHAKSFLNTSVSDNFSAVAELCNDPSDSGCLLMNLLELRLQCRVLSFYEVYITPKLTEVPQTHTVREEICFWPKRLFEVEAFTLLYKRLRLVYFWGIKNITLHFNLCKKSFCFVFPHQETQQDSLY